jgi:DNA-binding FadR family transcriptional regulator
LDTSYKHPSPARDSLDDQPGVAFTLARLRQLIESQMQRLRRQLPPERQLSESLGVGRNTIRKALAVLESDGTVVRHVGRGTFIRSDAGSAPPHLQALALGGGLAVDGSVGLSPQELMEVRYALEPAIAELAALAARRPDLEQMLECMRRREEASQLDDYEHWDYALHTSIATATHNTLLIEMLGLINRMRRSAQWRKFRGTSIKAQKRQVSNTQHSEIVHAICRADPEAAFAAMRTHLNFVSGRYRLYSGDDIHPKNAGRTARRTPQ